MARKRSYQRKEQYHPTFYLLVVIVVVIGGAVLLAEGIPGEPQPDQSPREISEEAFTLLNQFRQEEGKAPIVWDERAYQVGEARISDMREYDYFDHMNPHTGSDADTLAPQYGLSPYLGENIFWIGGGNTPARIIDGWKMSTGHKKNMLYKYTRGAIAADDEYAVFIGIL